MLVGGLDGCRAGWFGALADEELTAIDFFVAADFRQAAARLADCVVIGVDIPIGLPDSGARCCDREARRLLAPRRGASVFPAPLRAVLGAASYRQACEIRESVDGKRMSAQAFHILGKVAEVDGVLRANANLRQCVREVHPELAFATLSAGIPARYPKRKAAGFRERYALVAPFIGEDALDRALSTFPRSLVARDDVLDAIAVLLAARRIARGRGQCVPESPPRDAAGLEMAIWY